MLENSQERMEMVLGGYSILCLVRILLREPGYKGENDRKRHTDHRYVEVEQK